MLDSDIYLDALGQSVQRGHAEPKLVSRYLLSSNGPVGKPIDLVHLICESRVTILMRKTSLAGATAR